MGILLVYDVTDDHSFQSMWIEAGVFALVHSGLTLNYA
jgi:hypothetical protein